MKKEEDVIWKNPEQFGTHLLSEFERSFNPNETGHGFYFHGTFEQWKPIFEKAIETANAHFNTVIRGHSSKFSPEELQGAYIEYVYSLLNAANEMESLKILIERGIDIPMVMAISACKENIDRGGMENTKYMYIRLPDDTKDPFSLILASCIAAPFLPETA